MVNILIYTGQGYTNKNEINEVNIAEERIQQHETTGNTSQSVHSFFQSEGVNQDTEY